MKLPIGNIKINILGIIAGVMIIAGLFGPWLWRGYNPYYEINPETRERELRYHLITRISPFFFSIVTSAEEHTIEWFVSPGSSLSGVILISVAILFPFKFNRLWINGLIFLISMMACFFFFLNLGSGLWLGLLTRFGWGFQITTIGLTLAFLSLLLGLFS